MAKNLPKVKDLASIFYYFEIRQIPREDNFQADFLVKLVTTIPMTLPKGAYFELIKRSTIEKLFEVMQLDNEPCWIYSLINFLKSSTLSVEY